eukprot:5332824-Prymnesium_polylepis.1
MAASSDQATQAKARANSANLFQLDAELLPRVRFRSAGECGGVGWAGGCRAVRCALVCPRWGAVCPPARAVPPPTHTRAERGGPVLHPDHAPPPSKTDTHFT